MLTAAQWAAVEVIVLHHCLNPDLVAAVTRELQDARAREPKPTPEETNQGEEQHV